MRRGLLGLLALCGCSYDWSVTAGGAPDAGGDVTAHAEASADGPASHAEAGAPDAPGDAAGETGPVDSPAPPDCNALASQMRQARAAAVACASGPSACETTVDDECGCPVVVGDGGGTATAAYQTAVQTYVNACGKPPTCNPCGPGPQLGLCIIADAGGGALACYQ